MVDKPTLGPNEQFCSSCGEVIKKEAEICPMCKRELDGINHSEEIKKYLENMN